MYYHNSRLSLYELWCSGFELYIPQFPKHVRRFLLFPGLTLLSPFTFLTDNLKVSGRVWVYVRLRSSIFCTTLGSPLKPCNQGDEP
jgi:hypothetical protein